MTPIPPIPVRRCEASDSVPEPPGPADDDLMRAVCAGDPAGLREIIRRWQRPALGFISRYVREPRDAEDLLEELFVRVHLQRDRYRAEGRFPSWLFTIAANLCRNHGRWRRRHPGEPLERPDSATGPSGPTLAASEDVHHEVEQRAFETDLREALDGLPHAERTAFLLFQYEGLSYGEVAGVLQCSTRRVETCLERARRHLRQALREWAR